MIASRLVAVGLSLGSLSLATPASASDITTLFGRDPGADAAHACFIRRYTKAHLQSHPHQNVTDMLAFVSKNEEESSYYALAIQVNFRHIRKPFQISGSCSESTDGKRMLDCGVECDGGFMAVRVKNDESILVDIPDGVRIWDPDDENEENRPENARFGSDDKIFRLDRTDLKNCLPVIYDEELKAKVAQGAVTQ